MTEHHCNTCGLPAADSEFLRMFQGWSKVGEEWYCMGDTAPAKRKIVLAKRLEELRSKKPKKPVEEKSFAEIARRVNRLQEMGMISGTEVGQYVRAHYPEQASKMLAAMEAEAKVKEAEDVRAQRPKGG
jgi:hypothetical protein